MDSREYSPIPDAAPVHSWAESKREIESSFGKSVEELFESIDEEPLASGSIAQARLSRQVYDFTICKK